MPIVTKNPTAPPEFKPLIPKIEPVENKSIIIDTKFTPKSSLLKYVEGSPWTINYYSAYHDRDNALYGQDPGQSPLYQQYRKIEHLEIRVDTPLTTQQDQESKGFAVTGSAIVPLSVIPNEGDMFVADVGDGREGVFQISNSEKRSIYKESVYFIEYVMLYYSDNEKERRADLEKKVINSLHYVKEFAQYGQNALITEDRYKTLREIAFNYQRLKKQYFQWFFSKEFSTIILPRQTTTVYDSYVVKVIQALYLTNEVYEFKLMRALNVEDDNYLKQPTIWDALLQRDIHILNSCEKRMGLVSTASFSRDPMTENIFYSGIDKIIYPKVVNPVQDQNNNNLDKSPAMDGLIDVSTLYGNTAPLVTDNIIEHLGKPMTIVHPVTKDDYYILSSNFYNNKDDKSLLEVLAENFLQREANNPELVLKLMQQCWKWGGLERFYYIPLVMILASNITKEL